LLTSASALMRDTRYWILLLFVIRLTYIYTLAPGEFGQYGDDIGYYKIANNLIAGNGFSIDGEIPSVRRAPGYPIFLAAVFYLFPNNLRIVYLLQSIFDLLTFVVLIQILKFLWKEDKVELPFYLLFLFYLPLVLNNGTILTESLFTFIFTLTLYMAIKLLEFKKYSYALFTGILLASSTLIKATPLLLAIFAVPLILLIKIETPRKLILTFLFIIGFTAVLLPWSVRNYVAFGKVLPVTVGLGDQLYNGTHPDFDGHTKARKSQYELGIVTIYDNEVVRDEKLLKYSIERLKNQSPLVTISLFAKHATRVWFNVPFEKQSKLTYTLLLVNSVIMILAVLALLKTKIRLNPHVILLFIPVYFTVIYMPFPSVGRYGIPIMPLIMLFSAKGIVIVFEKVFGTDISLPRISHSTED